MEFIIATLLIVITLFSFVPTRNDVLIDVEKSKVSAKANLNIDYTKYDIKFKSSPFFDSLGDSVIYDDSGISIYLK
jgi:hypothetical protein